jgi:hypothetical protein
MAERYYDLNGRDDCVTAVIKVADKEFQINRVVMGARVQYSNLLRRMGDLLRKAANQNPADLDAANEFIKENQDFFDSKEAVYDDVLTLILTKNGYTYDKAWWQDNTDELDVRSFIDACLSKDATAVKKKTVKKGV